MKQPSDSSQASGDEMAQVRDILFGGQFREMERGMNELRGHQRDLHQAFLNSVEQLRTALAEQRRALEAAWSAQFQRINDRLRMEQVDRAQADQSLRAEFESLVDRLRESTDTRIHELAAQIESQLKELRRDERATLGQLFHHLGQRLRDTEGELPVPDQNPPLVSDPASIRDPESRAEWHDLGTH